MSRIIVLRQPPAQQVQRALQELGRRQWSQPLTVTLHRDGGLWQPQLDVYEIEDAFVVLGEMAGMRDSPIEVTLADNALVITGHRPELHGSRPLRFHQIAINEGPFQTAVLLPGPVDAERMEASYDDGLLTITLPKQPPQVRRIEITHER